MSVQFTKLEDAQDRSGQGPVARESSIVRTGLETLPGARAVVLTVVGDTDAVDEVTASVFKTYPLSLYGTNVEYDAVEHGRRVVRVWRAMTP